jgi:UDP-GlcNAc:undecaprenyl-phosphate GlcNAc-1-phosphate transferase
MMVGASLLALVFTASVLFCGAMIWLGPGDAPDGGRKTQAYTVPTAGGVGIWLAIIVGLAAWSGLGYDTSRLNGQGLAAIIAMVAGAGALGFADDTVGVHTRLKLVLLAALAIIGAGFGVYVEEIYLPFFTGPVPLPDWFGIAGTALWYFVMMNAVNFMDGSNGLAMGASAIILLPLSLFLALAGMSGAVPTDFAMVLLLAAAAICGFLPWNLTGRLYAGDTGSLSMGALLAGAGVYIGDGSVWLIAAFTLPFLTDVFLTLIWRTRAGRPLLKPHRDHAYQLLVRAGWAHWKVALLWWGLTLVCVVTAFGVTVLTETAYGGQKGLGTAMTGSFFLLLITGSALWCWQRVTLGRRLADEGR